jgi:hypothetical protein
MQHNLELLSNMKTMEVVLFMTSTGSEHEFTTCDS